MIPQWDRGVQYASTESMVRLEQVQAQVRMSAIGTPYDKAKAESCMVLS